MRIFFHRTSLIALIALAVALKWSVVQGQDNQREKLTIPVAVYIMVSDNRELSSQRTLDSVDHHFDEVNRIWSKADIVMQPVVTRRVSIPAQLLVGLSDRRGRGGLADFFRAIRQGRIDLGSGAKQQLQAFYVRSLGGPNGLKPNGVPALFVADNTSVSAARVTSHEIGHNLGLYHVRKDASRLLFSGSNGVTLTNEEQAVARYNAKRLLQLWSVRSFE